MGIPGFAGLCESNSEHLLKNCRLRDCECVIDALIRQESISVRCGGDYPKLYTALLKVLTAFRRANVKLYVVFDGPLDSLQLKYCTTIRRLQDQWNSAIKPPMHGGSRGAGNRWRVGRAGHSGGGGTYKRQNAVVLPLFAAKVLSDVCAELNIETLTPPGEGDPFIAALANSKRCAVVSDDSDFFMYNLVGGYIPLHTMELGSTLAIGSGQYIGCRHYHIDYLCALVPGLQPQLMPAFSCLVGNDYISTESFRFAMENIIEAELSSTIKPQLHAVNNRQWHLVYTLHWLAQSMFPNAQTAVDHVLAQTMTDDSNLRRRSDNDSLICNSSSSELDEISSSDETSTSVAASSTRTVDAKQLRRVCRLSLRVFDLSHIPNNSGTWTSQRLLRYHFESTGYSPELIGQPTIAWALALQRALILRPVYCYDQQTGSAGVKSKKRKKNDEQFVSRSGIYDCCIRLLGTIGTIATGDETVVLDLVTLNNQFQVCKRALTCEPLPNGVAPTDVSLMSDAQRAELFLQICVPQLCNSQTKKRLTVDWLSEAFEPKLHLFVLSIVYAVLNHLLHECDLYALCLFAWAQNDETSLGVDVQLLLDELDVAPMPVQNTNRNRTNNASTSYRTHAFELCLSTVTRLTRWLICLNAINELNSVMHCPLTPMRRIDRLFSGQIVHNLIVRTLNTKHVGANRHYRNSTNPPTTVVDMLDLFLASAPTAAAEFKRFARKFDELSTFGEKPGKYEQQTKTKKSTAVAEAKKPSESNLAALGNRFALLGDL